MLYGPRGSSSNGGSGYWATINGSGSSRHDMRDRFDNHFGWYDYTGVMGFYQLEHWSWASGEPTQGNYDFSELSQGLQYICEPNPNHPGKRGRFIPDPNGDPFLPVTITLQGSTFGASAGNFIAANWADADHVTDFAGSDRKITSYRQTNTSAPGGSTYVAYGNYLNAAGAYTRDWSNPIGNHPGRVVGVVIGELANSFPDHVNDYDPAEWVQSNIDHADEFHAGNEFCQVFISVNYIRGATGGGYNTSTQQWGNSVWNLLFDAIYARAPWLGVSWPDTRPYGKSYGDSIYDIQRCCRDIGIYGAKLPLNRTPVLVSQDPGALGNGNAGSAASARWTSALSDPVYTGTAELHEDLYGPASNPQVTPYPYSRYRTDTHHAIYWIGAQAYTAIDQSGIRNDAIQAAAENQDDWPPQVGSESSATSTSSATTTLTGTTTITGTALIPVDALGINCGEPNVTYVDVGGNSWLPSAGAWDTNDGIASSELTAGYVIDNTNGDDALFQKKNGLQGFATEPMVFRPINVGRRLNAGADWFVRVGKANTAGNPAFNDRASNAHLYIDGVTSTLYVQQIDSSLASASTAFVQDFGPFSWTASASIQLRFSKGTTATGVNTVNPSIAHFRFYRVSDSPVPAGPGDPTTPLNVRTTDVSTSFVAIAWNPSTITT